MAKKKTTKAQIESENAAAAVSVLLADECGSLAGSVEISPGVHRLESGDIAVEVAPVPAQNKGYVVKSRAGFYVDRGGLWSRNPEMALRFFSEKDALGYVNLHHRDNTLTIVEGE